MMFGRRGIAAPKPLSDVQTSLHPRVTGELLREVGNRDCAARVGLLEQVARGQRLRAVLVWVGAGAPSEPDAGTVRAASAIEALHLATLVHDDVIDRSPTRRGVPSTWIEYGPNRAVVAGDALVGVAFSLLSDAPTTVVGRLARALGDVCDGQMREFDDVGDSERSTERALDVASEKTGALMGAALAVGAVLAGRTDADADVLHEAGCQLGIAYQLLDDLRDVDLAEAAATSEDLAAGLVTPPWRAAFAASPGLELLERFRAEGAAEPTEQELAALWSCGAGEVVAAEVDRRVRMAFESAARVLQAPSTERLQALCQHITAATHEMVARNAAHPSP